mgnify:FL=1
MPRTMLKDEQWMKLKAILLQIGIYLKPKLRLTVEGIIFRLRTGCPWRDLPAEFGDWQNVYKRPTSSITKSNFAEYWIGVGSDELDVVGVLMNRYFN